MFGTSSLIRVAWTAAPLSLALLRVRGCLAPEHPNRRSGLAPAFLASLADCGLFPMERMRRVWRAEVGSSHFSGCVAPWSDFGCDLPSHAEPRFR